MKASTEALVNKALDNTMAMVSKYVNELGPDFNLESLQAGMKIMRDALGEDLNALLVAVDNNESAKTVVERLIEHVHNYPIIGE